MNDARIDEIRKRAAPFWIDRNLEGDWLVRDKDHVCFRSANEVNAREAHKELTNAFNASRADIEYLLAKLDAAERMAVDNADARHELHLANYHEGDSKECQEDPCQQMNENVAVFRSPTAKEKA